MEHLISREFSNKGVFTLVISYEEFEERVAWYRRRIKRPLIVVFLTAVSNIDEFNKNTKTLNKSYPIWLMIFSGNFREPICRYCEEPNGNIFHIKFNTEMLVACCEQNLLKEWWSNNNRTLMANFGNWSRDVGFKALNKESLYVKRNTINGTALRIALVSVSQR